MTSYVLEEFITFCKKNRPDFVMGNEACVSCEQAIWQIVSSVSKNIPQHSDFFVQYGETAEEKLYPVCWCSCLHKFIAEPVWWCDGNPPEKPKTLEEHIQEDNL